MHKLPPRENGFTLVELLVVVIIIGILAAIAIPRFLNQRTQANNAAAISDLRSLIITETSLETTDTGLTEDEDVIADEGWEGSNDQIRVCADLAEPDGNDITLTAWHMQGSLQYSWTRSGGVIASNEVVPLPNDCVAGHNQVWPNP